MKLAETAEMVVFAQLQQGVMRKDLIWYMNDIPFHFYDSQIHLPLKSGNKMLL